VAREVDIGEMPVRYLNRLSDALFVFGRWAAMTEGAAEPLWEPART
jgi:cob(I)alamin adenosyltransferase